MKANRLIKITAALLVETETSDLIVFEWELVVIGDLSVFGNWNLGINDNFFATVRTSYDFCNTVGHTTMVDKTS